MSPIMHSALYLVQLLLYLTFASADIDYHHNHHGTIHSRRAPQAHAVTSCVVPNTAALTFDDGPYIYLYDIVDTLNKANATGTFFFNGNNYRCIYADASQKRLKYAYTNGHQIASHTWSHADLSKLTQDKVHQEMFLVEQAFQRIVGITPAVMRPPYGEYTQEVLETSVSRGQTLVTWDFDSGDSVGASVTESNKRYDNLVKKHPKSVLTLNHETYENTAHQVLPHAIKVLQDAGYHLVSVAECLGIPAYQNGGVAKPQKPPVDGWQC